jgi:hypothetical protein
MQDAIMGIGVNCMEGTDDGDIWLELDELMGGPVDNLDTAVDAAAVEKVEEPGVDWVNRRGCPSGPPSALAPGRGRSRRSY